MFGLVEDNLTRYQTGHSASYRLLVPRRTSVPSIRYARSPNATLKCTECSMILLKRKCNDRNRKSEVEPSWSKFWNLGDSRPPDLQLRVFIRSCLIHLASILRTPYINMFYEAMIHEGIQDHIMNDANVSLASKYCFLVHHTSGAAST